MQLKKPKGIKGYVYRYVLNDTGKTIYIGKTDRPLLDRIREHSKESQFQPYLNRCHVDYCEINHPQYDSREFERCLLDDARPILNKQDVYRNTPSFIKVKPLPWKSLDETVKRLEKEQEELDKQKVLKQEQKRKEKKHKMFLKKQQQLQDSKKQGVKVPSKTELQNRENWQIYVKTFGKHPTWQQEIAVAMHSLKRMQTFKSFSEEYEQWVQLDLIASKLKPGEKLPTEICWNPHEYPDDYSWGACLNIWDNHSIFLTSVCYRKAHIVHDKNDTRYVCKVYDPSCYGGPNLLFQLRLNQNFIFQSMKISAIKCSKVDGIAKETLQKMHMYDLTRLATEEYINSTSVMGKDL